MASMRSMVVVTSAALAMASLAQGSTVFSNNGNPGDLFSNAGGSNQGQAVVGSSWYYNNVRNSGSVGINTTYARSGNGSAFLGGTQDSSKADIELLPGGFNFGGNFVSTGSLGTLGALNSLSYEWYRDSSSTARADLHPVIRLLIDADGNLNTTNDRGGLVFERAYNGGGVVTNQWVTENIFSYNSGAGANMWTFGAGMSFAQLGYGVTLSGWQAGAGTISGSSAIIGISLGIGSGWGGSFAGAVDNVSFGFTGGAAYTFNFEVVPTPGAMALLGLGGLVAARRRRTQA